MGKCGVPVGARVRLVAACCLVSLQSTGDTRSSTQVKHNQKAEVEGVEPEPPGGGIPLSQSLVSHKVSLSSKLYEDVAWVAKNPVATLADMAETIIVFLPGAGAIDVFETVSGRSAFPPFETLSALDRALAAVGIVIGSRLVLRRAYDVGVEASYPLREALSSTSDLWSKPWKKASQTKVFPSKHTTAQAPKNVFKAFGTPFGFQSVPVHP